SSWAIATRTTSSSNAPSDGGGARGRAAIFLAMRLVVVALRFAAVVLALAAVLAQFRRSLELWGQLGAPDVATRVVNFFSFFTIQSNLIAAASFAIGAVLLLWGGRTDPRWFAVLRACATTYILTTGVVYNLLLRGIELPQGTTVGWANEVLHVVIPMLGVRGGLGSQARRRLGCGRGGVIVVDPIVWAGCTTSRGPYVGDALTGATSWYPYQFLHPAATENGYLSGAFYVLLI